jgi:putative membrane protein
MMRGYGGGPGWEFGHHANGAGIAGMILMIILWIAVIVALVFAIRALILHSRRKKAETASSASVGPYPPGVSPTPVGAPAPSLLAILEERYARGEIDRNEFLQRKQDLGLSGPVVPPASAPTAEPVTAPVPPPTDTTT